MKVLSVVNSLNRGGIEVQLLQAIPWLREHGVEMDICRVAPGSLDGQYAALGCRLWQIPKTPNCLVTARHFQGVLAGGNYACVHCNMEYVSGGHALGAARAGIPLAVSFHSSKALSLPSWENRTVLAQIRAFWLRWHRHLIEKHAQILVGHSEVNIQNFAPDWRSDPVRCRVVLNGIRFPGELPRRDEARKTVGLTGAGPTLLHVGSFRPQKNHSGLLQILTHVVNQCPEARLLLVGDGSCRPAVEADVQKLGLQGYVRFEGHRDNVWTYYAAADVFVFPSTSEGFGNVLVESQAAGLPLVASSIPAHLESVAPCQQRFLFHLPDYRSAAGLVLEQAAAARRRENAWVDAAREHVRQRFGIERFAADLRRLYDDLVGTGCRRLQG